MTGSSRSAAGLLLLVCTALLLPLAQAFVQQQNQYTRRYVVQVTPYVTGARAHPLGLQQRRPTSTIALSATGAATRPARGPTTERDRLRDAGASVLTAVRVPLISMALGLGLKALIRLWIKTSASAKFRAAGGWFGIYATIPLVAGLVNWATNKLAVWMIFKPLEYWGVELVKREEGQPFGIFGWQGIVPSKVKKMGADVADTLLGLLNLKEILSRVSSAVLADQILPLLSPVVDSHLRAQFLRPAYGVAVTSPLFTLGGIYDSALQSRLRDCLVRVVDRVQAQPEKFIDLKSAIVKDLVAEKQIIVDLFQKCGRNELIFIVTTGLFGGFALGLLQMVFWILFPVGWTLAAGGALVGYLTDWFALKILFEPVIPINIFGMKLQGLFLQRQVEVSAEFAQFMSAKLLTPERLWTALALGTRRRAVADAIKAELKRELSFALPSQDEAHWDTFADVILRALPRCAQPTVGYMHKELRLEETIRQQMLLMTSAEFEKVLHPIFQEDELTLILVGTALGAAAGAAQLPFY